MKESADSLSQGTKTIKAGAGAATKQAEKAAPKVAKEAEKAAQQAPKVAKDAKKLKDAEILLRESAFRLKAAMLASSIDDRPAMESALSRINATESKVMGAVFAH